MIQRKIQWFGNEVTLACDGKCEKAWGINSRPSIEFDPNDPDDCAYLSDNELGEAPANPGTYEGGHAKPREAEKLLSKWCARECERSHIAEAGEEIKLSNFTARLYNQPWKHPEVRAHT